MGEINTNIRIDELASDLHIVAYRLSQIPAFYKLPNLTHNGDVSAADYAAIDDAIANGDIILTGKITRTGAWDDKYSENSPIIGAWKDSYGDIRLQTVANTLPASGTGRVIVPCTIVIEKLSSTTFRSMIMTQYPSA